MNCKLQLEKFTPADYVQLIRWVDSAEALMQFAGPGFTFPLTREQLDHSQGDSNRIAFKVTDAATGVMIGHAELYQAGQSVYLSRILIGEKELRGRGMGKQIVSLLLDYAFTILGKTTAQLNVFDWNIAAVRCYESAGFVINPGKQLERNVNGQTWIALNMVYVK